MPVELEVNQVTWIQPTQLFINNEFKDAVKKNTLETIDPSTGKVIANVQLATAEDVDIAVCCSRKAFNKVWKNTCGSDRGKLLIKLSELTEKYGELLATIEAMDSGKPMYTNALGDIEECASIYRYYGGIADKIEGKVSMDDPLALSYTRREPFGVVGAIIPWNYPLATASWKIAPALAAGNCIVLKVAENTPLSMLYFANLVVEAGFPPGVINIITGTGQEVGAKLSSHMDVDKLTFTGSTAVGQKILQAAAVSNLKDCTLELGGKSPLIVFEDCDLDQAAKWAYEGIMYNMGQICCGTSRLLVHESVHDKFVEFLLDVIARKSVAGDVFDKNTTHGPQISSAHLQKIKGYVECAKNEGAIVACGGAQWGEKGYYFLPTILLNVKPGDTVDQEEIFGPVASVTKFKTYEEAISIANNTKYGLGGAVFTNDIAKGHKAANDIVTGYVWINSSNDQDYHLPFTGHKMSGIGSELGTTGIEGYLKLKSVQVNLGKRI